MGALQNINSDWRKREVSKTLLKPSKTCSLELCHSYSKKCHSGLQNYKNATLRPKCWPNDVDMLIDMAETCQWCEKYVV